MSTPLHTLADQIELLVEDELTVEQRRKLFVDLDASPELWKTLAMLFAQQQVVRRRIDEILDEPNKAEVTTKPSPSSLPKVEPRSVASQMVRPTSALVALAGCLVLCFASGWWFSSSFRQQTPGEAVVGNTSRDSIYGGNQFVASDAGSASHTAGDVQLLEPVVGYAQWRGQLGPELAPVLSGNDQASDWLELNPPQVGDQIRQRLASVGMRAVPRRNLISVSLNGVKYTIPLDDFRLIDPADEML